MELISIIVPAYNVEKYIEKCIDSILKQSYTNFELLLIDDGSTDNTAFFCDTYAQKDSRVKCFHKPNGGLSDARNYGLERMSGKYVTFIDSDDYVPEIYLELLHKMVRHEGVKISMAPLYVYSEESVPICEDDFSYEILDSKEVARRMLSREKITHCSCGKLFHYSVWKKLRFPKGKLYEDYLTTFLTLTLTEKVAVTNKKMYFYLQRSGSIMHRVCDEKTVMIVNATKEVTPFVIENWPQLVDEALGLQVAICLKCMQNILNDEPNKFLDVQEDIYEIVKKNASLLLKSRCVSIKDKMKIIVFFMGKKSFKKFYNRFDGEVKLYFSQKTQE